MKKLIGLAFVILAVCLVFAACGCEHEYEQKITTKASCASVGIKTFTCTKCEDSYTEEIPMREHSFTTSTVTKKATCIAEGEKIEKCSVCGKTEIVSTPKTSNHEYREEIVWQATCAQTGTKRCTCQYCGDTKTEAVPKISTHSYTSKVIVKATYSSSGKREYTCTGCGNKYTETIERLYPTEIVSLGKDGSAYVNQALQYMSSALKSSSDTRGRDATANMLIQTGYAINAYKEAIALCGNEPELAAIKAKMEQIVAELEYVKKYTSVSTSNYITIVLNIYNRGVYQDVTAYEGQLITLIEKLVY